MVYITYRQIIIKGEAKASNFEKVEIYSSFIESFLFIVLVLEPGFHCYLVLVAAKLKRKNVSWKHQFF